MRQIVAACVATGLVARASSAQAAAPDATPPYFYFGRDYGSESLYSPLYVLLNRGFDVLQLRPGQRSILDQSYTHDGPVVLKNLGNPVPAISANGWGKFFRQEILPLSFTQDTAFWVPNYTLHLIGGGMTFRSLSEWFEAERVPLPAVWSAGTILASALVNETIENRGNTGFNTDAIADVYFFDVGGMLLFSVDSVAHFFSHDVLLSDWSLQPSFTFPGVNLNNQGNYFAFKLPLPFAPRLRPFMLMGLGTLGGLSYVVSGGYSVSAAAGVTSYRLTNVAINSVENRVEFSPSAAVFLDRNGSLLASLQVGDVTENLIRVNVFPNAVFRSDPGFGVWAIVGKDGRVLAGATMTRAFDFGLGYDSTGGRR